MSLHSDVRSIVDHYEFAMRDCPTPCPDGPWIVLKRLFAALNELLAAAPKEPESQLVERERQKERELKAVIAREKADLRAKLEAAEARIAEIAKVAHEGGLYLAGGVDTALNEVRRLTLDRWVPSAALTAALNAALTAALTAAQRARITELGKGGA